MSQSRPPRSVKGRFSGLASRRRAKSLADLAGMAGGAEALESRLMLAVFDPSGSGIGSQTIGAALLTPVDEVRIDINPTASGSQNDVLSFNAGGGLNGVLNLRVANPTGLSAGQTFSIITASGTGSLSNSFLRIKNLDAGNGTLNFVALQTQTELRLVVTDLPTPNATIVIDSSLTPSQQATKLTELTAWFSTGSGNTASATASTPGSLQTYGQRLVGGLTFTTDSDGTGRFLDVAAGALNGNPARLVVSAAVLGVPSIGVSAYGSTTLRSRPEASGTSRTILNSFTAAGFALGDQAAPSSLSGSSGRIGPVSFEGFTLSLSNIELTSTSFAGTVTVTAATASLNLGGSAATNTPSAFSITATNLSASVGISLGTAPDGTSVSESSSSGKFSITADELTMDVRNIVTVKATMVAINNYDSSLPASQTLVSVESAEVEAPKLRLKGTFTSSPSTPGLLIRGDGFAFGNLTVALITEAGGGGADAQGFLNVAGGRLKVKNPGLRVGDFSMGFNSAGAIVSTTIGSFGLQADEIRLTPFSSNSAIADRFNATATGISLDLLFGSGITVTPGQPVMGAPTGVRVKTDSINITLGFVSLTGTDIELNTAAGASDYFLIVAGNITANLRLDEFFGPGGPQLQISGSAGGFAVKGDGSFEAFTASSPAPYNANPFSVSLNVDASKVDDVLQEVADLPENVAPTGVTGSLTMKISWPDFGADPSRFLMRISGDINAALGGASGLTLGFSVTDLQVDSAKAQAGEFPIVGLGSVSGSVSGTIMGASFNGAIVLGLVRFDSTGAVLAGDATPDQVDSSVMYVGARGGLTLPNGWGVDVQFAFSEKGFLNFYLSTNLDIPLGTSGLSLTGLRGGVTFNATPLPNIDDPVDLRNSSFKAPDALTNEQWEEQVRQLVINQNGGTPGFLFEVTQPGGQDWPGLFDDNADPGLYLPEALRTEFLNAGIAIPRKAGVSTVETLEDGASWLLSVGDDRYIMEFDSGTNILSVSQITTVLPFELASSLPTGSTTTTAGAVSATIGTDTFTLVELFAQTGRTISASAVVAAGTDPDTWTVTDGDVEYSLTTRGQAGNEILAVTGGDPGFESGAGMTIRLDAGFSLSSTGGSSAWRLKADAIVQFTVGTSQSATKIVLIGDLSVGPEANPTLSVDARALIDLSQAGSVNILFLADFKVAPPAASASDPNPDAPVPFFSVYGNVTFSFVNNVFSFTLTGSQTRGVAVFDTAGLVTNPLGNQRVLLGAPSSPTAMDGTGRVSVTFGNNKVRANFAAAISIDGVISASNVVSASGDFTVEFSDVSVGTLGSVKLPSALYGAARLTASLDNIQILSAAGIEGNINLQLQINTTNTSQEALLFNPTTNADETITIARRSFGFFGDGNLSFKPPVVGSLYRMQITGAFGIDISADNGANLFIVGTMPVPIPGAALAGMTADVVGLLRIDGSNFAARLELGVQNGGGSAKFFSIGAALQLYINTAGTEASYTMPRDIAGRLGRTLPATLADRLVWSGTGDASIVVPARAPLITYSTDGAIDSTPGGYLVIQGRGNIDILDPTSRTRFIGVDASARLALQVDASNPGSVTTQFLFELTGSANLADLISVNLNAGVLISTTFNTSGPLPTIESVNMAGVLQLSASGGVGGLVRISGSGGVQINTFDTPKDVAGVSIPANSVKIFVQGDLTVGGVFKLTGRFTFENNERFVGITGNVGLDLTVATVNVDLAAFIYKSVIVNGVETNSPGLVINVGLSMNVSFLNIFTISGNGRLKLSTRDIATTIDSAPAGQRNVPARIDASTPYVNISIGAALNFLSLVTVNGNIEFETLNDTEWNPAWGESAKRKWKISGSLTAAAGVSFLGGAEARIGNARMLNGNLSGRRAVFYDTGEFDVDASIRVQIGPNEFNVNGRAYAFASYLRNSSGQKILNFGGGAALGISVDIDLGEIDLGLLGTIDLGSITFSFDAVSVSFEYNGNTGEVSIRPCVIGICKTFTLGYFKLPTVQRPTPINLAGPLSYTARTAADGPAGVYDETTAWNGGVLYINAGARAGFRNLSNSTIDEDYIIESDGPFDPATGRQNIKISAFGQEQRRANVSSIQAIMGDGIDTVTVRPGVLVPVTIDGGIGNDKITYSSTGVATIRGGDDNDRITAAGATGSSIEGGAGNDVITWLAGNGAAATVDGGTGNDSFISAFTDQADRMLIDRSAGEQFRVSRRNAINVVTDYVSVLGGVESLRINTRRGADTVEIGDFDALGVALSLDVSRYQSGTRTQTTTDSMNQTGSGQVPVYSNDTDADSVVITGRDAAERFVLTTPADTADSDGDSDTAEGVMVVARSAGATSLYTLAISNFVPGTGETLSVDALGGDDVIDASGVNKSIAALTLSGGADVDTVQGSQFADTISGNAGNDRLFGNAGNDTINAGEGDNYVEGGDGDDQITAGSGNDEIYGNADTDTINAGNGNNTVDGGAGNDAITTGSGDDTVTGGTGTDTYVDAGGTDTFIETRDRDLFITSTRFVVGTVSAGALNGFADAFSTVDENEDLNNIFEVARLTGGSSANTFVVGDVNGSIAIPGNPVFSSGQQWAGTITLDGLGGGDRYVVTVFGISNAVINVADTGVPTSGTDVLRIYGFDQTSRGDTFLVRRNFVANLTDLDNNSSLEKADRVNYNSAIEGGLTVDALGGDDKLVVDETSIVTTLRGGDGKDLFQFGQLFGAERTPPRVAVGDEIPSVGVILGTPGGGTITARLTPGPSTSLTALGGEGDDSFVMYRTVAAINLRGEGGDDSFSIRAFEQVAGTGGTTQGNTSVAGGTGSNLIEFVANAPIDIDGGEGIDTIRMLGTFRDDQYIVDATGISGPGTPSITFTNIEILEINAGDGNDEVFVRSTSANLRVVVYGGAGSDRLFVGAPVPGSSSNPPFINTLTGINGPVLLDGGPGDPGAFGLSTSVLLPTETDTPLPPGAGNMLSEEQPGDVDIVEIIATAETRTLTGLMSARQWPIGSSSTVPVVTLSGLGMGGDIVQGTATIPGGVSLRRLEVVDTRLGSGVETMTISAVLGGATTLFRGNGGADVFNVSAADPGNALLVIYTDGGPNETFAGTAGNDRVDARTASVPMVLDGGAGNDVLLAGAGNDAIAGGSGDDIISGGAGDDILFGDSRLGTDRLTRLSTIFTSGLPDSDLAGSDIINPGAGFNVAFGDHGLVGQNNAPAGTFGPGGSITTAVTVRPSVGAPDVISAFAAASPEFAGLPTVADGSDLVFGGAGRDTLNTGDGNDWVVGDHGSSTINAFSAPVTGGGSSREPKPIAGGVTIGADGRVIRTPARAVAADFVGATRPSPFTLLSTALVAGRSVFLTSTDPTSGDNDIIDTGAGDDVAIGGTGSDTIDAGAGNDYAFGDNARFDPAAPLVNRFVSLFTTTTGAGAADRILGGDDSDVLMGQQGADTLLAGSGDDDVIGGHNVSGGEDSADFIDAGAGDDVVIGDNGSIVRDPSARSPRRAAPTGGSIYAADLEVALTTAGIPLGAGATFARAITQLDTGAGAPAGTFGNDLVAGGAGNDVILAGNGDDTIRGDSRLVESPGIPTTLARSLDATTDGDDYVEGNTGNDSIFGDLGQDDLVGGSSSFFGLAAASRADGSDTIFGGDGTATGINNAGDTSATGAARDADTIAGDNADIFRIVDATTGDVRTFNYDAGATLRIVPRAVRLVDYTPDSLPAGDTGAADTINAEAGNDTVYGMTGNDLIYGDGQNDDLIGGSGDDWIYGGTGADSILGDDGRLLTSRNGAAEPLFGLAASVQQVATTTDALFTVPVFVSGTLLRTARIQGGVAGGADVIFGGLGDDTIHGGGGNDAISGAEALAGFYTPPTVRPALVFNPSMRRFTIFQPGFALQKLPNFFLNFNSGPLGSPVDDGKDTLFGDHGNDWLVGGTSSDFLFGGLGDDVLNADDNLDTTFNGANNLVDVGADAAPDIAFGGGGLDRMISNATNDRLIDWYLDFNQYISPYIQSYPTVTKNYTPNLISALTTLGAGLGMDTRLVEPDGELGIITSSDPQWIDQIGRPFNP